MKKIDISKKAIDLRVACGLTWQSIVNGKYSISLCAVDSIKSRVSYRHSPSLRDFENSKEYLRYIKLSYIS